MQNIFQTLKHDSSFTVDAYNQVTKEVFLKYFRNEKIFLKNKELLRTELVNYVRHIAKKENFEQLFEKILKVFDDAIAKNKNEVIKELASNLLKISKTDDLYMEYYIQNKDKQIKEFDSKSVAVYYFKTIDNILEGCYKPRLELFFRIYKFNLDGLFPNIENKKFGDIVNLLQDFDELIKDKIFNIVFSQWRNIATHKDFEIRKDNINISYGLGNNRTTKILGHQQLKNITFYINSVYNVLRLAEVIIYLNYTEEIMATDEAKNIVFNIRSEASLLNIIHNLQVVGFEFHSFNDKENTFVLNLYIKQNNDVQESIIHASQSFVRIAMALEDDEFQKNTFEEIKINILDKNDSIIANAQIDVETCIDYSFGKIDTNQLIEKTKFDIVQIDERK